MTKFIDLTLNGISNGAVYAAVALALVLMLGCGYSSNTSLHLAEWRQPSPPRGPVGAAVRQPDGSSRWITWTAVLDDTDDFEELGAAFEAAGGATVGPVGRATARLMSQRALVDFAVTWMAAHRA